MSSLIGITGLVFGPGIPLNGLTVYYDFSNPNCYPGTGTTVNNLAPYPTITGNLSGSLAGGNPAFTLDGNKSYISFVSSSEQYMLYTLPTFGTSFTQINIYASPTSNWDGIGDIGGNRNPIGTPTNGWVMAADTFTNPLIQYSTNYAIETPTGNSYYALATQAVTPSSILVPHFYFLGWNESTKDYTYGLDNTINTINFPALPARSSTTNSSVYFARLNPEYSIAGYGNRFTSVKLYLHMLYNRKLSSEELTLIYRSLKNRFGF